MAYKYREEIVGKRFLSVSGFTKLKLGKISEWGWRAGVVRAATHKENTNNELQVLVEYDDVEWHRREWISIYKDSLFNLFMVEQGLCWAERRDPYTTSHGKVLWPALTFSSLVSTVDVPQHAQPVEFLLDRELAFTDYKQLKPFQEWDATLPGVKDYPELKAAVRRWAEQQDGQRILLATPSVLVGYRVEVYRAEGTTQWYTAVIVGYNEATRDLTVTDDTVLEEHNEDPALVQMRLIGDGVVESIMRGENVGITARRSRSTVLQTQHHQQPPGRVVRGLSGVTTTTTTSSSTNTRKPRSGKAHINSDLIVSGSPPEDKGSIAKTVRKRKSSENESTSTRQRNGNYLSVKEDLENKQGGRKRNTVNRGSSKKKVLEEANNSKLRDVQVRVEDCLQNVSRQEVLSAVCRRSSEESASETVEEGNNSSVPQVQPSPAADEAASAPESTACTEESANVKHEEAPITNENDSSALDDDTSNGSSVQLVSNKEVSGNAGGDESVREQPLPISNNTTSSIVAEVVSEEDDCVIVTATQQRTTPKIEERECSSRGDDDGPLSSSSPFSNNRMELTESVHSNSLLRFPDDRSDSGVSSLRSGSGDERSGSRSSALSLSDEPQHIATQTTQPLSQQSTSNSSTSSGIGSSSSNRSPLFIHSSSAPYSVVGGSITAGTPASNVSESVRVWRDPNLLLESEPHVRHVQSVQHNSLLMSHPSTPASGPSPNSVTTHPTLYPPVPPPPSALMSPHISHHPHLAPPNLYSLPSDILWSKRYIGGHILPHQVQQSVGAEELLERDRASAQDRDRQERLRQSQEIEKQKEKEREQRERERQERERLDKLEKEKQDRTRENVIKAQAQVQQHFEESLRRFTQNQPHPPNSWSGFSLPPPRGGSADEERKRVDQEHHLREQQRHMVSRPDSRDKNSYYTTTAQRPPSVPSKTDYPPPAHSSRLSTSKNDKLLMHPSMKTDAYGYQTYQSTFFSHEPKMKSDHHKSSQQQSNQVMMKNMEREREILQNPSALHIESKNSVIVKHEKNPHHLDSRMSQAHSKSPQLRTDLMPHYMTTSQSHKAGMYTIQDYRTPTLSPHHPQHPHTPSPHHHEPQNLGKSSHHRSSGQLPSPHHQQQSPHHPHAQQHPSPELRYRTSENHMPSMYASNSKSITTKGTLPVSYPYIPKSTGMPHYSNAPINTPTNMKPKVSSPAPHHIYGKPAVDANLPVNRSSSETLTSVNPLQLTSKPLSSSVSSPYQQVSQYHPPMQQNTPPSNVLPPPAHSSRPVTDTRLPPAMYERMYPGGSVPGGLSVKPSIQHGTSPPTAASAPSPISRTHPQYSVPGGTYPSQSMPNMSSSEQTQPLNFCVTSKYDSATSPKRKATPVSSSSGPMCLEKKRRVETPPQTATHSIYGSTTQPQLARVSEPSPLIANAATTITTVVNAAALRSTPNNLIPQNQPVVVESLPDVSVTAVSIVSERSPHPETVPTPPASSPQAQPAVSTPPLTIPVSITVTQSATIEAPGTPVKLPAAPPNPDSEKSNSPGPNKSSSSYPVRHLKKAWLQRHTGEDVEDTTGVTGTGSCVTLPINIINNIPTKEPAVTSLHNIGSMAVNSISKPKHFSSKANNRKQHKDNSLNGDTGKADDSSSSDQERNRKDPPKRKPPKVKRKKGGGAQKKTEDHKKRKVVNQTVAVVSESGSDSDKETGSEKDSDSGASSTVAPSGKKSGNVSSTNKDKEPRKRGRRPKTSKNDKSEEPRPKKSKEEALPQRDPFRKPPVGQLKKTGESFLQDGPCFEVAPKLAKCRECRWTPNQRSKNMPNIFCRFYAFRRLRYTKNAQLAIAGFSDPHKDASDDDLKLWLPSAEKPPTDLDLETSRFLLKQVGDHFCNLLTQEKDAHGEHMSDEKVVAWKRVVQGVREMCDVCETTLFNIHWTCGKCGFVVCLDCYKGRKNKTIKIWGEPGKDRDDFSWLLCTNRQPHEQEKLMLTQIIAGDSLLKLGRLVHEMRELWNVEQLCDCSLSKEVAQKSNGARKETIKNIISGELNGIKKEIKDDIDSKSLVNGGSIKDEKNSLCWLADVALSNEDKKNDSSDSDDGTFSTLRELLIRPSHKHNGSRAGSPISNPTKGMKKSSGRMDTLDEVISSVIEDSVPKVKEEVSDEARIELKHFIRKDNYQTRIRGMLPIRIMTLSESKLLYPDIPHSWLCDGKLLRLSDTTNLGNTKIFQDQWKRGQPVLVSDVAKHLGKDLWTPDAFIRDFGDEKNDLVNCLTGNLVLNQPMRKFWEGFEHLTRRLKDDKGNPMLLKLKDWPPGEDFAELLPTRFADLMKVLPLPDYTHRNGRLNLASRLPECFVRPDLGPKMYNAYGSALHPSKGTTNLHLDISDAVNVMVYVGIPKDGDSDEHIKEAFRAIDEAGCDILTRRRVRDKGELPGALWHIYNARDADKIRDLLNKVVVEKGGCLEPNHDPIHDQSCYLDGPLRERLYKEYGVEGYAIVQCLGDAVFIPAGAPHQVRNLHNCIKVAEDFVSPENVSQCFHLTQEFRDLSDTHTNHEDKLQIKNIIYHAVKDSLSTLTAILNKHAIKLEKEPERNGNGGCADELSNKSKDSSEPA